MSDNYRQIRIARRHSPVLISVVTALCCSLPLTAAILPEDRADALFHSYDGGGVTIQGPSVLARKQVSKNTSATASYYVDSVTSASIDVVTQGSPYEEQRREYGVSVDYLHDNTTMSVAYTDSKESDYIAKSYHYSVSHTMFGDLSTVSLGFSRGSDIVKRNNHLGDIIISSDEVGSVDRFQYRLGWSQILTKKLIVNLGYEIITDEGSPAADNSLNTVLNNPYRNVSFNGSLSTPEVYPLTHTSNAVGLRALYYLPYRAALNGEVHYFQDSWEVTSGMANIGYTHPFKFKGEWLLDVHFRYYSQTAATFYADNFDQELKFMARDKELSTFNSNTIGAGISYTFPKSWWKIEKSSFTLSLNRIQFNYQDFSDFRINTATFGQPYSFTANVLQFYMSIWY